MSEVITLGGDTFERISRRVYGEESGATLIAKANPGATEPFIAGVNLSIPSRSSDPSDKIQGGSGEDVSIMIDGQRFRFWDSVTITRSMDSMDTVYFGAPFEPDNLALRELFKPFTFKPATITVGGELLFTGTMVGVEPIVDPERRSLTVDCYSVPGVLNDCTLPASFFPEQEFDGLGLRDIAKQVLEPFGIGLEFDVDQGDVFERVACNPDQRVLPFLIGLAKQRNLVITSTQDGRLRVWKSITGGVPVATLVQGESPLMRVEPFFNPQQYFSHLTGINPTLLGAVGSSLTTKNTHLSGVVRPLTFKADDTKEGALKEAVDAAVGRMFGSSASYTATVDTWRTPAGELWKPNTEVRVQSADAMIYNPYNFVIRSVAFTREGNREQASLQLVFPGSFDGKIPESLPWD